MHEELKVITRRLRTEGTALLAIGQEMVQAAEKIEALLGDVTSLTVFPMTPLAPLIPDIVIDALTAEGPLNRHILVERIRVKTGKPATVNHLAPVLTAMKEAGRIESAGPGVWRIKQTAAK